jgi:hypothetical protein
MEKPQEDGTTDKRRANDKASTNSLTSRASSSDRGQWV